MTNKPNMPEKKCPICLYDKWGTLQAKCSVHSSQPPTQTDKTPTVSKEGLQDIVWKMYKVIDAKDTGNIDMEKLSYNAGLQDCLNKLKPIIPAAEAKGREEALEEIKSHVLGELSRSELQATVESMAREVGHTYSAINGVKNSHNALLVIAHRGQQQSIDLPKEKTVTLEDIKKHRLRGTRKALVVDNYALFEMSRDVQERVKRVFESFNQLLNPVKKK